MPKYRMFMQHSVFKDKYSKDGNKQKYVASVWGFNAIEVTVRVYEILL